MPESSTGHMEQNRNMPPALVCVMEQDGPTVHPIWYSSSFRALTGFDPAVALGDAQWWPHRIHPEDRPDGRFLARLMEIGHQSSTYRFRHRDGHYIWLHESADRSGENERDGHPRFTAIITVIGTDQTISKTEAEIERRFHALVDMAAVPIVVIAPDGKSFIDFNRAWCDFTGYDQWEMANLPLIALNHPEDRESDKLAMESLLRGETDPMRRLRRFVHKSGRVLWGEASSQPLFGEDGTPQCVVTSVIDMTERLATEAALKASQERFRDFSEVASDWLWETDAEHRFSWHSENMPLTPLGKTRWEISDTDLDPEGWRAHRDDLDNHRPFRGFEYQIQFGPDHKGWVSVSGKPLFDEAGQFTGYRGTGRDITARKIADRQTIENQALTRRLLETTQEGYWRVDNNQITVDVNPAMCRILDRTREEIVGHSSFEFLATDKTRYHQSVHKDRLSGRGSTYEMHLIRPDGSRVICLNNGAPIYNHKGEIIGSAGFLSDITAMKEAQQRLETAREDAERANRAKSLFLNSMSHELRTPLNAIMGFSEILELTADETTDADTMMAIRTIRDSADILLAAFTRVLEMTSIETGAINLYPAAVMLAEKVERAVNEHRDLAGRFQVTVTVDRAALDGTTVWVDPDRLVQAFNQLLDNAIRYNRQGGTVTIGGHPVDDGTFRLCITDTGSGIVDTDGLFELFVRLGREAGQVEGIGIGLNMARSLVRAMDGDIGFTTTPGEGSTFWLDLPRPADPAI